MGNDGTVALVNIHFKVKPKALAAQFYAASKTGVHRDRESRNERSAEQRNAAMFCQMTNSFVHWEFCCWLFYFGL